MRLVKEEKPRDREATSKGTVRAIEEGRRACGANQERMAASISPHVEREIPGEGWLHQENVGSRGE